MRGGVVRLTGDQPGTSLRVDADRGSPVSRSPHAPNNHGSDHLLRIGSLFSGYEGLDFAVEHVFDAETVWFSELNEPVERSESRWRRPAEGD